MPSYHTENGQRVDLVVRGYVTYNTGGYLNISDKPLVEGEPEEGCARLDIPEWMIVGEPTVAPLWPDKALLLVHDSSRPPMLVRYNIHEDGRRSFSLVTGPKADNVAGAEERIFGEKEFLVGRNVASFERLRREDEED